ncbi:MAG: hypothetical protein ACI94D_000059, partial [Neolewinella sp.]
KSTFLNGFGGKRKVNQTFAVGQVTRVQQHVTLFVIKSGAIPSSFNVPYFIVPKYSHFVFYGQKEPVI